MNLLYALLIVLASLFPSRTYSVAPPTPIPAPIRPVQASLSPQAYVAAESEKYGVNPAFSSCIVSHESQWTDRSGDDGNSRGYWQISKIWHPEVSDACAYNLACSTNWSLRWITKGHAPQWSTFWLYCSSTPLTP